MFFPKFTAFHSCSCCDCSGRDFNRKFRCRGMHVSEEAHSATEILEEYPTKQEHCL